MGTLCEGTNTSNKLLTPWHSIVYWKYIDKDSMAVHYVYKGQYHTR